MCWGLDSLIASNFVSCSLFKGVLDPQPTAKFATLDFWLKNNIQASKNQSTHKIEAEILACTVEGNGENETNIYYNIKPDKFE